MRRSPTANEVAEEGERLLAPENSSQPSELSATTTTAADTQGGQTSPSAASKPQGVLVIPASTSGRTDEGPAGTSVRGGHTRTPSVDSSGSSGSGTSSSNGKRENGLCRICLEEDTLSNLEQPCACTGTQKYAHHDCIQRWVNEKGHLRCEICDQQYRGDFSVPPQPAMEELGPGGNMFSPMFAIRVEGDLHPGAHDRAPLDFLDESDHYYQRNPLSSWCFTFVIFIMFLVVLHHTMIVADGIDDTGGSSGGSTPPSTSGGADADEYAASLTLFLFWIGTKAFLIGIPLYTVMRIAARQARREQYEAFMRSGAFDVPTRRYMWRVQLRDQDRAAGGHVAAPTTGHNAV